MRKRPDPQVLLAMMLGEFGRSLSAISELMLAEASTPSVETKAFVQESDPLEPEPPPQVQPRRESRPSPLPTEEKEASPTMRRAILLALAQFGRAMTPAQVGFYAAKAHKGGAFVRAMSELKAEDKVRPALDGKLLRITEAGFEELGEWTRLPEGRALFEHWCGKLGPMAELILRCLYAEVEALTQEQIGEKIEKAHKGGAFVRAFGDLRKMELVAPWMTKGTYQLSAAFRKAVAPTVSVFDKTTGEQHLVDARGGHKR